MLRNGFGLMVGGVVAFLLVGCEGVTTPSGSAEVAVTMEGGVGQQPATNGAAAAMANAEGSVEARARVYLKSSTGEWIEVTRGAVSERVEIDGSDGARLLARARVNADHYSRVRVEFERVTARLDGDGWLAVGLLGGEVRVGSAGGGSIVVERAVDLRASGTGTATLHVALNANEWIRAADGETRTVAEAAFASSVRVIAR